MKKSQRKSIIIYYCGYEACNPCHFFGPAIRPHYLIHFVLSGKGIYSIEKSDKKYSISEGQAFLIKPGEVTYYQADSKEPWEYVWIAFDGEEAELLLEDYQLSGEEYVCQWKDNPDTERRENEEAESYIRKIGAVFEGGEYSQNELLGFFYLIFSKIKREETEDKGHFDKGYLEKSILFIRHNYSYDIHIRDIARFVGIERTYLYKIFMKYQNCSPKHYLTEYRLMVAKDMLVNTRLSITEIAYSSGFHDSSVFCKKFQKKEKISPLQYRKKQRTLFLSLE